MVHLEKCVWIIKHSVLISFEKVVRIGGHALASKVLLVMVGIMETRTGFFHIVSAVVGLSVGVGMMTATVLLGVAALLQ
jgi:hypothetical protein